MAMEQIKLSPLEQWVQDLPNSFDGVRVLADFWVHDIIKYDADSLEWILEAILDGYHEAILRPGSIVWHRTLSGDCGWESGLNAMIDNLEGEDVVDYEQTRLTVEEYYGEDTDVLEATEGEMMSEFFKQIFKPQEAI